MHTLAQPARFQRLSRLIRPWLGGAALLLLSIGLYLALMASPPDYQQGEVVRIMYLHVPAAWWSLSLYAAMAGASLVFLVWRHAVADVTAQACAGVGAAYALLTLLTGMLWGKPMWGAWWVWDARLTSVLVLFFLYLGVMALRDAFQSAERGAQAAAGLSVVGAINLPIIKFSVEWWNTLHQPASVLREGGSAIDPAMLKPLLVMALAFGCLAAWLVLLRADTLLIERKHRRRRLMQG